MRTLLLTAALTLLPAALAAPQVAAQDEPQCREVRPGLLQCTEIVIEGRGPSGFYVLTRSQLGWEPPPLRRELHREVARTVRRAPF